MVKTHCNGNSGHALNRWVLREVYVMGLGKGIICGEVMSWLEKSSLSLPLCWGPALQRDQCWKGLCQEAVTAPLQNVPEIQLENIPAVLGQGTAWWKSQEFVWFAVFWQIGLLDDSAMCKPLSPPCCNVKLPSLLLSPFLCCLFGWRLGDLASFIHERSPVIYVRLFYVHGVNLFLAKSAEKQPWR